jgi:pSer/pThr/pTyr-binding forkhead associated (FHA) protein
MTIGRLPECAIFLEDTNVSRKHAEIQVVDGAVRVIDLGSTNGTRVNGLPIHEHILHDGEIITVGTTSMRFEAE